MTFPEHVENICRRGCVDWADERLSESFRAQFVPDHIPVEGVRHLRQWGLQVDDEKAIAGHERSSMPDEELWEVQLRSTDGSVYEVNSELIVPSPL